jgi:hypothetical protein
MFTGHFGGWGYRVFCSGLFIKFTVGGVPSFTDREVGVKSVGWGRGGGGGPTKVSGSGQVVVGFGPTMGSLSELGYKSPSLCPCCL